MGHFRLMESPAGFHWVLEHNGIVHASGRVVPRHEAEAQLDLLAAGAAPPVPQRSHRGWVYAFIDREGRWLGESTEAHQELDTCVDGCIRALAVGDAPVLTTGPSSRTASPRE